MRHWTVAARLYAAFILVMLLFGLAAFTVTWTFESIRDSINETVEVTHKAKLANEWRSLVSLNFERGLLAADTPSKALSKRVVADMKVSSDQITVIIEELKKTSTEAGSQDALTAIQLARENYTSARRLHIERSQSLDLDGRFTLFQTTVLPKYLVYDAALSTLVKTYEEHSEAVQASDQKTISRSEQFMFVLLLGAMGISAMMGIRLVKSIASPLAHVRDHLRTVADGNLAVRPLKGSTQDEIGQLQTAAHDMTHSLQGLISDAQRAVDAVAMAGDELASGTKELATRTEHAAANLEQTAASMGEITAAVQQNLAFAQNANKMAAAATDSANEGVQAMQQMVATMEDINNGSTKIADIIGVIDTIAFQTNILALNAAVEAARAGEQGRGFAVVASEVRALAKRSADAAREIKSLIQSSAEKVGAGSSFVADAGTTMTNIVGTVRQVSNIINEIVTLSADQSHGISQVNEAIQELDQMIQKNAAMVEESSAAADSMRTEAHGLGQVLSAFRLA